MSFYTLAALKCFFNAECEIDKCRGEQGDDNSSGAESVIVIDSKSFAVVEGTTISFDICIIVVARQDEAYRIAKARYRNIPHEYAIVISAITVKVIALAKPMVSCLSVKLSCRNHESANRQRAFREQRV